MATKTQEVAKTENGTGGVLQGEIPPSVKAMILDLQSMAQETENDPNQVRMDIMERILTAETLEEAAAGTTTIESLIQVPVTVKVKSWNKSAKAELGVFAVLDCVDDQGQGYTVTCGGTNIVPMFYRAQKEDRALRGMFRAVETRSDQTTYLFDILAD